MTLAKKLKKANSRSIISFQAKPEHFKMLIKAGEDIKIAGKNDQVMDWSWVYYDIGRVGDYTGSAGTGSFSVNLKTGHKPKMDTLKQKYS